MVLPRKHSLFICSVSIVLLAGVLEIILLRPHVGYIHSAVYRGVPRPKSSPSGPSSQLYMPVMVIDFSSKVGLYDMCPPDSHADYTEGCLRVPADWGVGLWKLKAFREWKIELLVKECYHDVLLWKWRSNTKILEGSDVTKELCEKTSSEYAVASAIEEPSCTVFHDASSKLYIKHELTIGNGEIIYNKTGRFIHGMRANFPLSDLSEGGHIYSHDGTCFEYEVADLGIDVTLEVSQSLFKILNIPVSKLYPVPSVKDHVSDCWFTNAGVEVCDCVGSPSLDIPILGPRAATLAFNKIDVERLHRLRHSFCNLCRTHNATETELKLVCDQDYIYRYSYSNRDVNLKFYDGRFRNPDWVFDSRLGVLVPLDQIEDVPRFPYMPKFLYIYNKTYIANCTVTSHGTIDSDCVQIKIDPSVSFSELLDHYEVSSVYLPKLKQHLTEEARVSYSYLSSIWKSTVAGIQSAWDTISGLLNKIIFWLALIFIGTVIFLIFVLFPKSPRGYDQVVIGRRGTRIAINPDETTIPLN